MNARKMTEITVLTAVFAVMTAGRTDLIEEYIEQ